MLTEKSGPAKPLKRSRELVRFSKEHHSGLLLVWKIRQGLRKGIEPRRIGEYVVFVFRQELQRHFEEEESYLFTALPVESELYQRGVREHDRMFDLVSAIGLDNSDTALLGEFAASLEDHIRFEERILFNHIQDILPEENRQNLAAHARGISGNPDDEWSDHFWEPAPGV